MAKLIPGKAGAIPRHPLDETLIVIQLTQHNTYRFANVIVRTYLRQTRQDEGLSQ